MFDGEVCRGEGGPSTPVDAAVLVFERNVKVFLFGSFLGITSTALSEEIG